MSPPRNTSMSAGLVPHRARWIPCRCALARRAEEVDRTYWCGSRSRFDSRSPDRLAITRTACIQRSEHGLAKLPPRANACSRPVWTIWRRGPRQVRARWAVGHAFARVVVLTRRCGSTLKPSETSLRIWPKRRPHGSAAQQAEPRLVRRVRTLQSPLGGDTSRLEATTPPRR